jgi:D-alanyl-D-alanine carboxypeptidase (penicillin-binding protein 5/6)
VGLFPGSNYTLDNLFYALFLPSANDAANAIARSRGSIKGTVRLMNEEAQRLQAFDTTAKNPSGLDAKGQLSSAYDLALFGREGLKNPDFARYARTVRARFPDKEPKNPRIKRSSYQIYTENRLMAAGYKGMIGIKTGYTTKAQRTFIGAAERNGRRILITMMANQGPTKVDAKLLLDWGFVNAARISTPVGQLVDPTGPAPTYTPQPEATPTTASSTTGADPQAQPAATQSRRTSPAQLFVLVFGIAFAGFLALIGYFSGGTNSRQRMQRNSGP